jgi:hypothetical protein
MCALDQRQIRAHLYAIEYDLGRRRGLEGAPPLDHEWRSHDLNAANPVNRA